MDDKKNTPFVVYERYKSMMEQKCISLKRYTTSKSPLTFPIAQ